MFLSVQWFELICSAPSHGCVHINSNLLPTGIFIAVTTFTFPNSSLCFFSCLFSSCLCPCLGLVRQCRITQLIALKHIDLKTKATFAKYLLLDTSRYWLFNGSKSSPQTAMFPQRSIPINLRTKHISIWNKKRVCCIFDSSKPFDSWRSGRDSNPRPPA